MSRTTARAGRMLRLAACAIVAVACGSAEVASISFGTGGSDCELQAVSSTFTAGATVRMVAAVHPLPSSVIVSATRDGSPLHAPETIDLDGTVPCVFGTFPDLEAGHYEFVVKIPESRMPPLTGSFEVAP